MLSRRIWIIADKIRQTYPERGVTHFPYSCILLSGMGAGLFFT